MFFVVSGDKVYGEQKNTSGKYPLVSISIDANNAITVKDEGEGITTLPEKYYRASIQEVVAMFGITSAAGYKPPATIAGNDPVLIYLDEASKAVILTAANPTAGDFSAVASSDTNVATVAEEDGTFTITPVAAGTCNITAKWTPTDTDFAASTVTIPVTVAKRKIEFEPVRDQSLTKAVDKTITLQPNVNSALSYTVLSTDSGICSPAMDATAGHENDLILTVADASPLGVAIISVSAVDASGKSDDSDVMRFKVRLCDEAVTITAIDNQSVKKGESKDVTVVCAGATVCEAVSSDTTKVKVEIIDKLKVKVTALGTAGQSATVTVYCDKRGYGEDSEDFTVTIT